MRACACVYECARTTTTNVSTPMQVYMCHEYRWHCVQHVCSPQLAALCAAVPAGLWQRHRPWRPPVSTADKWWHEGWCSIPVPDRKPGPPNGCARCARHGSSDTFGVCFASAFGHLAVRLCSTACLWAGVGASAVELLATAVGYLSRHLTGPHPGLLCGMQAWRDQRLRR